MLLIVLHVHVVDRLQSNLNQVSSLLHHQLCCSQRNVPLYLVLGLEQEVSQQEVGLMLRSKFHLHQTHLYLHQAR